MQYNVVPCTDLIWSWHWSMDSFDNFHFGLTLVSVSEVWRNTAQMQQPSFQKRGFDRANHQDPWCLLFVWCPACWWLGPVEGFLGKNLRKFCEWVGESQNTFWREWPVKPCQKLFHRQPPVLARVSVMLAAGSERYEEVVSCPWQVRAMW